MFHLDSVQTCRLETQVNLELRQEDLETSETEAVSISVFRHALEHRCELVRPGVKLTLPYQLSSAKSE